MEFFGLSETAFRLGLFASIFLIMAILETWLPRRKRRFTRGQRWTTNIGILVSDFLAVSAVTFVIPLTAVITAFWASANGWGLLNILDLPLWLEWLIAIIILDWVIWAQHLITHKVPVLWRLHRVHHSDVEMDATTAVRFHPLEIIFSIFVKSAAILVLGPAAAAVVVFEALVNGSAIFNHANFNLPRPLDIIVRAVFVTPDMHRVHHSVHRHETDSNYGFFLSIWDKIFNTYVPQPQDGHDEMEIGLAEWQDDAPTRFTWAISFPFRNPPHTPSEQSKAAMTEQPQSQDQ